MANEPLDQTYVHDGAIYLPGVTTYPESLRKYIADKKQRDAASPFTAASPIVGLDTVAAPVSESLDEEPINAVFSEVNPVTPEASVEVPPVPHSDLDQSTLTRTPLPDDFPALQVLNEAGLSSVEDVLAVQSTITSIPGIGPARAAEISEWLQAHVTLGD